MPNLSGKSPPIATNSANGNNANMFANPFGPNNHIPLNANRSNVGRRRRNLFAPGQIAELHKAFLDNKYLKPEEREMLAKRTGLSIQQVGLEEDGRRLA